MSKKIKRINTNLKKLHDDEIDCKFHRAHEEVFSTFNCLDCANCCKTKGPQLNKKDINRIAAHLKLEPQKFAEQYLQLNEDQDYVLQQLPCPFLMSDNKCKIYSIRPEACKSYPHTNTGKLRGLLDYFETHSETCPAIEEIYKML